MVNAASPHRRMRRFSSTDSGPEGKAEYASSGDGGDDTTALCTALDEKVCQIEAVLAKPTIDLWELRELALTEDGLVNDSIRQRAWPALAGLHTAACMGVKTTTESTAPATITTTAAAAPRAVQESVLNAGHLDRHHQLEYNNGDGCCFRDHAQVELDVNRCTWHLLTGTQRIQRLQMEHKRNKRIARIIRRKQRRLAICIKRTLQASSVALHYYQGFHDIACIFLSTLRDAAPPSAWTLPSSLSPALWLDLPSAVLLQVSQSHLFDCMQETFQPLQTSVSLTIFPLLAVLDPHVHQHLSSCEMSPLFVLPWILTWFSHDIRDTALVKRLFDAFLASHPALPLYVCVAMLLHPFNRSQILETECDFSLLHQTLVGLPKNSSAFGWKYQPGQGYVSDQEDDRDTESIYSARSESSFIYSDSSVATATGDVEKPTEGEMVLLQEGLLLGKNSPHRVWYGCTGEAVSISSSLSQLRTSTSSFDENATKVPFQELLDLAVQYMHRIPPRRIVSLAKRLYGREYVETLLSSSRSPRNGSSSLFSSSPAARVPMMFQDPVSWILSPTAPAEWWLKARVREVQRGGLTPRSSARHNHHQKRTMSQRRLHATMRHRKASTKQQEWTKDNNDEDKNTTIKSNSNLKAMPPQQQFRAVPPRDFVKLLRRRRRDSCLAPLASGMALSIPEEKRREQQKRSIGVLLSLFVLVLATWQTACFRTDGNATTGSKAASQNDDSSAMQNIQEFRNLLLLLG